ncbi:MAG: methyltransferase domain-containing protein [Anaerolineales bacterium]|nr:methyltransferase domain-containing protein [Anaerolineales bacterium]
MSPRNEWMTFFDGHAPVYMSNIFTKNTIAEVEFIIEILSLPKGSKILDIGCGTGRHSVEFATRGYQVLGIDLSFNMLRQAKMAAKKHRVDVDWVQADATDFGSVPIFDAAICLCEGAFGLLGSQDDPDLHDQSILENAFQAIKPGGGFLLTASNGMKSIRKYSDEEVQAGLFDPLTLVEEYSMEWDTPEGKRSIRVRERGYTPGELSRMVRAAGFQVLNVYGGTAGRWERRMVELDEFEIMIVAKKINPNLEKDEVTTTLLR